MRRLAGALGVAALAGAAWVQDVAAQTEVAKPDPPVLKQVTTEFPKADRLEARIMTATLQPGTASPWHTHAAPVAVYVIDGVFTLEMEGKDPITLEPGGALLEPINVKMRAVNRDPSRVARVVIFQVSEPEAAFLTPTR